MSTDLPVIGICAAVERVRWAAWNETVVMAPRSYAHAVQRAGALALLLPPDDGGAGRRAALLDQIDGLLLAGGSDIDPALYGAEPHPETKGVWPERDEFERDLTLEALERGMPILGICRGMQVLNVALGGSLSQHLPEIVGHGDHRHTPGTFGDHEVVLDPGSLAERAAGGRRRLGVKSHHHQGVDRIAPGLRVSGHAVEDETVEALELPGHPFCLGVLWHPEEDVEDAVIGALVTASRSLVEV
ncbi:gamma-glutamyl-gamma-aminobutyrate hydrolase family protein [Thermoleophilia bacterium SCSIO 60948]|nr:gamma-glutamyl-gamma-aminobutyrate hydrolase family protein [Thermoleophilia bacterium SCSIO 60948]